MTRYLIRRGLESLAVLLVMSFAIYGLMGLMPGDPIDVMVQSDPNLTPADAARLKALYGLDRPIGERYLNWLGAALEGDLGYSRLNNRPVLEVLGPRLLNTILLMGLSLAVALAIAVPVGVLSALRPYSKTDYAINFGALAGISIPVFWLALMLIVVFSVQLGWLPAGGMQTIGSEGWLDRAKYLILPVLSLSLASVGGFTRFMREDEAALGLTAPSAEPTATGHVDQIILLEFDHRYRGGVGRERF